MKLKFFLLLALLAFGWPIGGAALAKPILVYYMPWYVAKPFSSAWGWHWTMDHFNPDVVNASGERQIASWYYPLIGPYDSADPVVLEYQVLLMKLAGIDGVVVDWYGADNYLDYGLNNERTAALFSYARKAGLKFSLCYEDATIQQKITGGYLTATGAVAHAQQTMHYVETKYFGDASYLRLKDQPVLLNFGPQFFKQDSQWQQIFSVLSNPPAFFTEDNRLSSGVGAFNWPPMWLSQAPGTGGVLSSLGLEGYLTSFEQNGQAWPAYISSAFPRFHDIYQKAGIRNYWGYLGDRSGDTFRDTLTRALTNNSAIAQIVTWNDYGEGTMVEPTREYGYRDLGIIQDLRRQFVEPGFAGQTNDLTLALRVFQLRRDHSSNATVAAELDRVFAQLSTNNLPAARLALTRLEQEFPPPTKAVRDGR